MLRLLLTLAVVAAAPIEPHYSSETNKGLIITNPDIPIHVITKEYRIPARQTSAELQFPSHYNCDGSGVPLKLDVKVLTGEPPAGISVHTDLLDVKIYRVVNKITKLGEATVIVKVTCPYIDPGVNQRFNEQPSPILDPVQDAL